MTHTTLVVTPTTSLADMERFLSNAAAGDKVFGVKSGEAGTVRETKTLYMAKAANLDTVKDQNEAHKKNQNLHRTTGHELIENVLSNSYAAKPNDRHFGAEHTRYKAAVNTLLTNAIDKQVMKHKPIDSRFLKWESPDAGKLLDLTKLIKTTTERTAWIGENFKPTPPLQTLPTTTSSETAEWKNVSVPDTSKELSFPNFQIGGVVFEADRIMGKGGYGIIVKYNAIDGSGVKIIKMPYEFEETNLDEEQLEKHVLDVTQERLAGGKYSNPEAHILGFTDHVVLKNRMVALIGDQGGLCDVSDFSKTMHNVELTPHARRLVTLTMTQDMGRSLTALHDAGGLHNDMKSGNQVVDKDGHTNLIDLGYASRGPTVAICAGEKYNHNPQVAAPESIVHIIYTSDEVEAVKANTQKYLAKIDRELAALLKESGRGGSVKDFKREHKIHDRAIQIAASSPFAMDGKADVFGIGNCAFRLATGRSVAASVEKLAVDALVARGQLRGDSSVRVELLTNKGNLSQSHTSHGVNYDPGAPPSENSALVEPTGDPVLDLLLDDLLSPNPGRRTAERDIARHNTMNYGADDGKLAVSSPEVRKLIVAIANGNKAEIEKAQAALLRAFPEPDSLKQYEDLFAERAQAHERLEKRVKDRVDKPQVFERV